MKYQSKPQQESEYSLSHDTEHSADFTPSNHKSRFTLLDSDQLVSDHGLIPSN